MFHLQEPSQNKSKSGLSKRMPERSSHGFETISIVVRQSWGIEGALSLGRDSQGAGLKVLQ